MTDANAKFVDMAHPHSWLLTADNLHKQALKLYSQRGQSSVTRHDFRSNGNSVTWDSTDKAVFLLGGFALENAIKAFLVYENPHWISNGKLARQLRSHSLTALQRQAIHIPYKTRYLWVLGAFEEGIESWARYPCGLTAETSMDERAIQGRLWAGYIRLMHAYGNKLKVLLSSMWNGPHGFAGKITFSGDFVEMTKALAPFEDI